MAMRVGPVSAVFGRAKGISHGNPNRQKMLPTGQGKRIWLSFESLPTDQDSSVAMLPSSRIRVCSRKALTFPSIP